MRILDSVIQGETPASQLLEQLQELAVQGREWQEQTSAELFPALERIQSRTFGILILQIIKTIQFIAGLLPAGRIVLIVLAVVSLLVSYFDTGQVTGADVRRVIEETGVGKLIDQIIQELGEKADEAIVDLEALGAGITELLVGLGNDLQVEADELRSSYRDLVTAPVLELEETAQVVSQRMLNQAGRIVQSANLSSNLTLVVQSIVDSLRKRIEALRTAAERGVNG